MEWGTLRYHNMHVPLKLMRTCNYSPHCITWASYQIRKIAGCACAGNAGNVFPRRRFQRKPLVGDPGMHHGTCVTHVPWCMSGPLTCSDGESIPGIPGACAPAILRIWQEAHSLPEYTIQNKFIIFTRRLSFAALIAIPSVNQVESDAHFYDVRGLKLLNDYKTAAQTQTNSTQMFLKRNVKFVHTKKGYLAPPSLI